MNVCAGIWRSLSKEERLLMLKDVSEEQIEQRKRKMLPCARTQ